MRRSDVDKVWARLRGECQAKGTGEQGIALISVILLVLVLSFVSAAAIVTSTTELRIGGNFKTSTQSFYNAEAGVQYALGQIRKQ
ncbi:MAG: pilus assembly PilX N-terminal domain-containing protein, partial [Verrucomicrobia bacterium]|nr:pilus assembly PilX N-terminal domain-containing protein [Deltaproteobacteria bacterium]